MIARIDHRGTVEGFYVETDAFIPHGQRCEADDGRGSDFGQCAAPATGFVVHQGHTRYVCTWHLQHYHPDAPAGAR